MSSAAVHENKNDLSITIKKIFDQIDEVILKSNKAANNKSNDSVELDQSKKSNVSLVESPNVDAEIVICPVDSIVKNEQDENENNKSNDSVALDPSEKSKVCLVETPNVDAEIVICPVDSIVKNEQDENENNKSNDSVALDPSEKSKLCLVETPNVDAEFVICPVDSIVKNEQDENENKNCVSDLLRQETMISDSSYDESSPKKSKQFTFTDSDLPDSDEIKEFLKSYPRPTAIEPLCIESESKSNSEDEDDWFSRRRRHRNKKKLVTKVTIENLPARFMTRQRVPNIMLSDKVSKNNSVRQLQSIYLKKQEDEMDVDIIHENIKRLKRSKGKISVNNEKPVKISTKSKSLALRNTKKSTLDSILTTKRITRGTRSMKNKTDGKNIKNKCISSGVKKPDNKRKPTQKKDKSILPAVEGRRSKRHHKAKVAEEDTMKVPELIPASLLKKSMHKRASSSSESQKSLKRSLVQDSDVQMPKRTRSFNNNVNNASVPARSVMKAQKHQQKRRGKRKPAQQQAKAIKKLNSNRSYLNVKTRSQSARTRSQQASQRTRD